MRRKIDKDRNRKKCIPGLNAERTFRSTKKDIKCNEDTIIRTEIHGIIVSNLQQGKDDKYIVDLLSRNERYSKYAMYFENWVKDMKKKVVSKEEREK